MKYSVIIPYHERPYAEEHLSTVLACLVVSRYEKETLLGGAIDRYTSEDSEILVVKDAAVHPETGNCCLQINVGLVSARGDVFILLHQDVAPNPFSVDSMANHVRCSPDKMYYATVYKQKYLGDPHPNYHVGPQMQNEAWFLMAASREKLIELGGVDEDFWRDWGFEDTIMLHYWKKHFDIEYVAWANAIHLWHPDSEGCIKRFEKNRQLYFDKTQDEQYRPNAGHTWGWGKFSIVHNLEKENV